MDDHSEAKTARVVTRTQVSEALDRSKVLNAATRRHWRSLLPHLAPDELADLWTILADADRELSALENQAAPAPGSSPADSTP